MTNHEHQAPLAINPTVTLKALGDGESRDYSDIAMTNLFNAYVLTINSARQAIWQRYSITLTANSLILGFLGNAVRQAPSVGETVLPAAFFLGGACFGLLLCLFWGLMYKSGVQLFRLWNETAVRFSWPGLENERNPFVISEQWRGNTKGRWLHWGAVLIIWLFALAYTFLLIYSYQGLLAAK